MINPAGEWREYTLTVKVWAPAGEHGEPLENRLMQGFKNGLMATVSQSDSTVYLDDFTCDSDFQREQP